MRKILYLITIILTFSNLAFTQNIDDFMNQLDSAGGIQEVNFGEFIDHDNTSSTDIETALRDAGVEESLLTDPEMTTIIDGIAGGTINTLAQAEAAAPTIYAAAENAILEALVSESIDTLYQNYPDLQSKVNTLANALKTMSGFAQANAQTSTTSSLFGHQGYKLFAVSFGFVGSVATDDFSRGLGIVTSSDPSKKIEEELKAGGLEAGVAMQGFTANVGINMSWLIDRLYLGAVFGTSNTTVTPTSTKSSILGIEVINNTNTNTTGNDLNLNMSLSTATFGVTANYQLIKPFNIPILYRWNGISIGSGFIYNSYNIEADGDMSAMLSSSANPGTFLGTFSINSSSFTIPLEISTGVRLLSALNLSVGAGVDLKFGGSNMSFNIESKDPTNEKARILRIALDQLLEREQLSFPYSNDGEVKIFNPRVMAGLGIGLGPVTFDVYANIYVLTGFTFGANFVLRI